MLVSVAVPRYEGSRVGAPRDEAPMGECADEGCYGRHAHRSLRTSAGGDGGRCTGTKRVFRGDVAREKRVAVLSCAAKVLMRV